MAEDSQLAKSAAISPQMKNCYPSEPGAPSTEQLLFGSAPVCLWKNTHKEEQLRGSQQLLTSAVRVTHFVPPN